MTEKRLLYQQFLAQTQQTGESVDLYVLDQHNLFKRSSITKTQFFEDFVDYTIRPPNCCITVSMKNRKQFEVSEYTTRTGLQ